MGKKHSVGDIFHNQAGDLVRIDESGEERPFTPPPYDPFRKAVPDPLDMPRRADGTIAPFYGLTPEQLAETGQDTPARRAARHDGWTPERQRLFIERLAASASVADASRYVGMSRQSARDLYNRSAPFRAAWDDALRSAVSVLAETAFDRAVNGTQEQVWYQGRMVGFREKYNDRLLMFLLRVRDPMNYAPLAELHGWQRFRGLEAPPAGTDAALAALAAAEQARLAGQAPPPALPHPADRLAGPDEDAEPGAGESPHT